MSAISFFFGWWGIISFFVTLFTLPLNVVTFLRSLSLPAPGAAPMEGEGFGPSPGSSGFRGSGLGPPGGSEFGPLGGVGPGFGAPPGSAAELPTIPAKPSKTLPVMSIVGGVAGLGTAGLVGLIGVGMMVAPNTPRDPQSGLLCLLSSALCCGAPGLLGAGYGAWRLDVLGGSRDAPRRRERAPLRRVAPRRCTASTRHAAPQVDPFALVDPHQDFRLSHLVAAPD